MLYTMSEDDGQYVVEFQKKHGPDEPVEFQSYTEVKALFEKQFFRIKNERESREFYVRIGRDGLGEVSFLSLGVVKSFYRDWHFWEPNVKGGPLVKKPFLKTWFRDVDRKTLEAVVFNPRQIGSDSIKEFNLWVGLKSATYPPVAEAEVAGLIQPVFDFLNKVVTGGNQTHTDWLLDWFARIVQRPWQPTRVGVLFYCHVYTDAERFLDWFRGNVLGRYCTWHQSPINGGNNSAIKDGIGGRILTTVYSGKKLHEFGKYVSGEVKSGKYDEYVRGINKLVFKNYVNMAFISERKADCKLPKNDEHFTAFECDPAIVFRNYDGETGRVMARAFYQFLMARQVPNPEYAAWLQESRPITPLYEELKCLRCD